MSDWGFLIVYALVFSVFLMAGVSAIFLPQKTYVRLLSRFLPVAKDSGNRLAVQRRLAGVVLAFFGLYGLRADLLSAHHPAVAVQARVAARPAAGGIGPDWLAFAIGLGIVSAGFFIALNPEVLVRWCQRTLLPEHELGEGVLRTWRLVFRVTGALMVFGSTSLFTLWLRG